MKVLAIILGLVLVDVAVRGTYQNSTPNQKPGQGDDKGLWPLLKADFEKGNFLAWFAAILIIGMIGYIPQLKPIANSMLALVIVVLFLVPGNSTGSGGFFAKLQQAVTSPVSAAQKAG